MPAVFSIASNNIAPSTQKLPDTNPDEFTDVALDYNGLSTPLYLPNGNQAAIPLEYSPTSSSTSSRSSSARSSTNSGSEDFDVFFDNVPSPVSKPYDYSSVANSVTAHQLRKLSSRRSSTNTILSTSTVVSSDEETDAPVLDSDPFAQNSRPIPSSAQAVVPPQEHAFTSNKLNGYLINSLKSNTSLSLLNPNRASVNSRASVQSYNEPALFDNSALKPSARRNSSPAVSSTINNPSKQHNNTPLISSSFSTTCLAQNNSRLSLDTTSHLDRFPAPYSPTIAKRLHRYNKPFSSSGSVLPQPSHTPRIARPSLPKSASSIVLSESANESDAFAPLPSSKENLQRALSRSGIYQQNPPAINKRPSTASLVSQNSSSSRSAPSISLAPGLTAQQRLRLCRSRSSNRLSNKQLELQFEAEDLDDDIPNDSLVWNVPLSPALYAKTLQARFADKAQQPKKQQTNPGRKRKNSKSTYPSSNDPSGSQNNSLASINESTPTLCFSNVGLESLSEDARDLTVAYQQLPTATTFDRDINLVNESAKLKLPPKNRNSHFSNGGLPVSKEKEAVLSRTRPSWLPPKSPKEERRHVHEYQQMMARASQLERKATRSKEQKRVSRQDQRFKDEKIWKSHILPNFEKITADPSTRDLWWRGIPPKYRSIVWKARAGNKLGITKTTFARALSCAKSIVNSPQPRLQFLRNDCGLSPEQVTKLKSQFVEIESDIARTYPNLKMFAKIGPMHDSLVDVLQAFAVYRPDIGYQNGLNHIAATLLLYLNTLDAFIALCNMLSRSLCQAMYIRNERELTTYYQPFLKVLRSKMPSLYIHFKSIRLAPSVYLGPILRPLFACYSVNVITRIWDVMFLEGDEFLLHAAVGFLSQHEHKLYGKSAKQVAEILQNAETCNDEVRALDGLDDGDVFMDTIKNIFQS